MASSSAHSSSSPVRSAYFSFYSEVRPSEIDTSLFTHLYYAFASMDPKSYNITRHSDDDTGYISTFSATVRNANPAIKTLLSICGHGSNPYSFSEMAASRENRANFIKSSIAFARSCGFDGLDLDWEYPNTSTDMSNLAILVKEWSIEAKKQSPPLLLTAAVRYTVAINYGDEPGRTYPAATMALWLDWLNIMAYDLHGDWEPYETGAHTALYDNTTEQRATINFGVQEWLNAQLPASSAVLGLAAYGQSWFLADRTVNGVGAPASAHNAELTFSQIQQEANATNNARFVEDRTTVSAYAYWTPRGPGQRTIWAGFDNPTTIASKVNYLRGKGLRGYFFWKLDGGTNNLLYRQASQTLLA